MNSSQEDICALSLSNISHLLFPQVQSNMEFTLLAFVYSLHRAGFFFFFFWKYDFSGVMIFIRKSQHSNVLIWAIRTGNRVGSIG